MRTLNFIITGAWALLTIISCVQGAYYIGLLQLLLAIHTLSDALEAK
jgi:hypothetical protein